MSKQSLHHENGPLLPESLGLIEGLALDPALPLILCDADEVLLQFALPFEGWLQERGYALDFKSFALFGNIRRHDDQSLVEGDQIHALVDQFLQHVVDHSKAVDGAIDAVRHLQKRAQMVIVSNIPHILRLRREQALAKIGMALPVLSNHGPKGPMVAHILRTHQAPAIFLDDLPQQHASVAEHADHVHRIHFVADQRLAGLIGPAPDSHHRIDRWPLCVDHIETHLTANGF
ncbi:MULTISPECIES: hypothetical protein [unclassified Iodidimonas]|uniref:hypothetical protein n=1 Tax=unclassified Iodidimonas TaxID=2626145 RepID=UPI002482A2FE|nr:MULTISPECIES: hypothetical protein [unclassified Iodidimonas]